MLIDRHARRLVPGLMQPAPWPKVMQAFYQGHGFEEPSLYAGHPLAPELDRSLILGDVVVACDSRALWAGHVVMVCELDVWADEELRACATVSIVSGRARVVR